jgi:hypothetical protein
MYVPHHATGLSDLTRGKQRCCCSFLVERLRLPQNGTVGWHLILILRHNNLQTFLNELQIRMVITISRSNYIMVHHVQTTSLFVALLNFLECFVVFPLESVHSYLLLIFWCRTVCTEETEIAMTPYTVVLCYFSLPIFIPVPGSYLPANLLSHEFPRCEGRCA